ncbi:MAG: dihydrodipicolinate synthase family protein [Deltaproteobacteria bacterium]|nr:dihydrodipicolinate synthase family protein [Deltaproteobacteria bacterium]
MEYSRAPRGLIVDLITPLKDGAIDETGLKNLLAQVLPHAQGLLLAGARNGEGENLKPAMRNQLLKIALETVGASPVSLFLRVTGNTEQQTRENILGLQKQLSQDQPGSALFWVDTPLVYHSNRGLPDYYRDLLSITKMPLVLHNDPEAVHTTRTFKRRNIRTAVLKELTQIEGIEGLIFSGSLERAHHYQRACRSNQHFRIYDGDEKRFLEFPSMGGVVSVGANLAPRAWKKITQSSIGLHAHRENYPDRLQQIWELGDYLKNMVSLYGEAPAKMIKTILSDMGVIETPQMLTSEAVEQEPVRSLKKIMRDFGNYP